MSRILGVDINAHRTLIFVSERRGEVVGIDVPALLSVVHLQAGVALGVAQSSAGIELSVDESHETEEVVLRSVGSDARESGLHAAVTSYHALRQLAVAACDPVGIVLRRVFYASP